MVYEAFSLPYQKSKYIVEFEGDSEGQPTVMIRDTKSGQYLVIRDADYNEFMECYNINMDMDKIIYNMLGYVQSDWE